MEQFPIFTREECPVCGHRGSAHFVKCKDHTVSGAYFDIVSCTECGFKYTNPIPTQEEIGKYYKAETYISHTGTKKGLVARLYHAVRSYTLRRKLQILQSRTKGRDVLDYGCGTGNFLEICKKNGWNATGVEPDSGARSRVGSSIAVFPDLDALKSSQSDKYSAITLWHVLEHVYELQGTMAFFRDHLSDDGVLVIAVPNYRSADAKHYGAFWAAFDVPRHLYHFDRDTLRKTAEKAGFSVEDTLPMKFDSYYVSLLSEKYKGRGISGLFSALWMGFRSNFSASRSGEYSSLIYILRHGKR